MLAIHWLTLNWFLDVSIKFADEKWSQVWSQRFVEKALSRPGNPVGCALYPSVASTTFSITRCCPNPNSANAQPIRPDSTRDFEMWRKSLQLDVFFGAEISFYLLSCTSSWRELKSSTLNQLYRADNHFTRSSNRFSLLCIGSTTRSTSVHLDFLNLLHIFVLAAFFRICLTMSAFALCKSTSEGVVQETVDFVPKIPNMFDCKAQLVHSEP